ncbi:hypothetical protein GCM10010112_11650 [Actinoplanes lobatus]|uniref:Uncharacterized protein n=1 Tax=Actinoplanes lobatus TaxID=113568 RepID=A0A7W7HDM9_9ACTN|nr:hypothetical protein [Actinoplanes lobatus]MBB4748631.1 hypothetical protein [Actinoplanes lobatus]GGN58120.1 hypothetical protein GCM10010112_11650 [Actinoplanes lobatus]GIE37469.1 hypothetical protein Alo02nite_03670 [Actinoplanes lobatus]
MSDGGLDDLFGAADGRVVAEEREPVTRRRSAAITLIGNAAVIGLATVVATAGLRALGLTISLLLLIALLTGLRLLIHAVAAVAPPPGPRLRSGIGAEAPPAVDALRATVRRWERNLDQAHSDPDLHARNVLPVLAELADERLRLRHGITRASDPRRARELLGDDLWATLSGPGRRALKARDVETYLDAMERL